MIDFALPRYQVRRDAEECVGCGICVRECANGVHVARSGGAAPKADHRKCVNCLRCVLTCPTRALTITRWPQVDGGSAVWTLEYMQDIATQAASGGVLLSSMGNPLPYPVYWDHLLLNAIPCASRWRPACSWAAAPWRSR